MVSTVGARKSPVHRLAWIAFAMSLVALLLAWYGSLHAEKQIAGSPLREARGAAGLPSEPGPWYERLLDRTETAIFGDRIDRKMLDLTERSKIARYSLQIVAFVLPFVLGLTAAFLGGSAMTKVEKSGRRYVGNFHSVFAIMIGGFAAVIAGCMMVSVYVWPHVPSFYTL
jgi:hypothetical protein